MGEMKIELLPNTKVVNKIPYKLSQKYKDIVKKEIDNMLVVKKGIDKMLTTSIIYLANQYKWASHVVVQPNKHDPKKL